MNYFEEYLKSLKTLISFPSVQGAAEENKPFGKAVYDAMQYFHSLSESFGFNVINYDNFALEINVGEGEEIGIIGHLDVVPAGGGWDSEPYMLTETEGKLFGRGVLDDKGPILACLYILKELKEEGVKFNKKLRLFAGGNEETGWKDAEYLKEHANLPEYGFSPDGNFPVSYAEKGIAIIEFKIFAPKNFYNLKGGTVINAVCGEAFAKCRKEVNGELLNKYGLIYKDGEIVSKGKSAHGSCPDEGKNAMLPLFEFFAESGENVKNILDCLFYDKFGLCKIKTEQGAVTFSPDLLEQRGENVYIKCDCRFPYSVEEKDLKTVIDKFGIEYEMFIKHPTQYVEKEGFLVNTLLSAYKSVMGGEPRPISQGGSTFARVFKKGVAFGPEFPDEKSTIHQPNESVEIARLKKMYDIYKIAIFNLVTK